MAHKYPTAKALLFFYFSFDIYHFKVDWISVSHSINLKSGSPGTSKHIRIQSKQVHTLLFPAKHYFNKQNSTTVQDQEEVDNHPDWSVSQIMPPKQLTPWRICTRRKNAKVVTRLSTQTQILARSTYKNTSEVAWYTGPKPKAELHALGVVNTVIQKGKESYSWTTPMQNIRKSICTSTSN
jgi:hypothetical protein